MGVAMNQRRGKPMAKQKPAAKKGEAAAPPNKGEYTPTPREKEIVDAYQTAKVTKAARIKIKKSASGAYKIDFAHEDEAIGYLLFMHSIGVPDLDFAFGLLGQITNISGIEPDEINARFVQSVIENIKPRDAVEVMLATQMAAVHMATMTFARKLGGAENILQQDSRSNAFNKLARTFAAQVETLKRYRATGEQRVIVERVTVQSGGQAIVGNVSHGVPANDGGQAAPPALSAPIETPLPSVVGGGEPQKKARLTP
jgi:hypothetical protein